MRGRRGSKRTTRAQSVHIYSFGWCIKQIEIFVNYASCEQKQKKVREQKYIICNYWVCWRVSRSTPSRSTPLVPASCLPALLLSNRNNHLQFIFSISLTSMKNQLHKFDMAEYTHEDLERDFAPLGEWDDKATKERIAQIVKEGTQSTPELVSTVFLTVFLYAHPRCYYCLIRYCALCTLL